jgi:hypothetical protein
MKIKKHTKGRRRKNNSDMDARSLNDTITCLAHDLSNYVKLFVLGQKMLWCNKQISKQAREF